MKPSGACRPHEADAWRGSSYPADRIGYIRSSDRPWRILCKSDGQYLGDGSKSKLKGEEEKVASASLGLDRSFWLRDTSIFLFVI
jgi:hypothetical protein